jgi:ectoine hydroxylase-related dioxygenase (phytanoyl-CoA dioxygenase family)
MSAVLPTDEEVARFGEQGYYFSRRIFSDEEVDAAIHGQDRYYAGERDSLLPDGTRFFGWAPEHGDVLRKNDYAGLQNSELNSIVRHPLIGAIAARLIGTPVIRLWHDQLLYKPPDKPDRKAVVGWHTDRGYWKCCSSSQMITAWVPFHDCNESMGTIMMIAGSHRWPDNTNALDFFSSDLDGLEKRFDTGGRPIVKVPANLKRGCVSFHHCLTIHGSGPNRSDRPRRSIAIHMQDASNRHAVHRKPDGSITWHYNDRLCRQTADATPDYTDPAVCPVLWQAG